MGVKYKEKLLWKKGGKLQRAAEITKGEEVFEFGRFKFNKKYTGMIGKGREK